MYSGGQSGQEGLRVLTAGCWLKLEKTDAAEGGPVNV